tara:strand:- start:277 stop:486 length:210 start_codon:yes stop_codon:yes gene_type:complete
VHFLIRYLLNFLELDLLEEYYLLHHILLLLDHNIYFHHHLNRQFVHPGELLLELKCFHLRHHHLLRLLD